MNFRQVWILKSVLFLIGVVMGALVFLLNVFGGVASAKGEVNLKLSRIEDVQGWLDCELSSLEGVDVINIELCDDIYIGYDVFGSGNGAYIMDPRENYIFNFTAPKFKGITININGRGRKMTICMRDLLFLRAGNCVVNLNDVRLKSLYGVTRQSGCICLTTPSEGQKSILNLNGISRIEGFCSLINGGAIFAENSTVINMNGDSVISECCVDSRGFIETFIAEKGANCVEENGGAICAQASACVNMNDNSSIVECDSRKNGGAISVKSGTVKMSGKSRISSCRAGCGGGAIYGENVTVILDKNSEIVGCEAAADFGGWAVRLENGTLNMSGNCRVVGREFSHTEAILVEHGNVFMNESSEIVGCKTRNNGAICVFYGLVEMKGKSKISKCKGGEAGAIYIRKGDVSMNGNSVICDCEAEYGGAIDVLDGSVNMNDNSIISDCQAGEGGAIDVLNGKVSINANSVIRRCKAAGRGAVYCGGECATLVLNGGKIEDCQDPS